MIDVDALLNQMRPGFEADRKNLFRITSFMLKKILHQEHINQFIQQNQHLVGLEFLDAVLDHFEFRFQVSNRDRMNIPDQGRLIIVANHPLGSLDGLAIVKLVSEIRTDVRIVATEVLSRLEPLSDLFLSVDNFSSGASHFASTRRILSALEQEQAVILFPTGEVSRIRPHGVRDGAWKTGFYLLAKKARSPVLPVYIEGRNSALFYSLSTLYKPLGTLLLVNEMFRKQNREISFKVGKPIPPDALRMNGLSAKNIARRMRKQVYRLAKKKRKYYFQTIENVIHPASRKQIRSELRDSPLLGETQDGKEIYLFDYQANSSVIREIGRLRELSFRQVQEGTGNSLDTDQYDRYYRHLVLWDDDELEIVGTYRIAECREILEKRGFDGLYTHTLFEYPEQIKPVLEQSIELGRSFIQPRYWGKRSLDYLWYGIGAYLLKHPEIRYMTGPVSLSASYPEAARELIVSFYAQLFGNDDYQINARLPFAYQPEADFVPFKKTTDLDDYKKAYSILKEKLDELGVRVPTLYKQYVELCEPGGCEFLQFNVDPLFGNCVDALILVHVEKILGKKRLRYIESHRLKSQAAA